MNTLVSILMPVYNAESFINEAIDSILNQTFSDFEFIIINDGSSDLSEKLILEYNDLRIKYYKNDKNLKLIKTLNRGIELSKGKYIVRMDADDISDIKRVQVLFEFMEENTSFGLVGSGFEGLRDGIYLNNKVLYKSTHNEICYHHLYQMQLCHGTCIIRKSVLTENNLRFDENYIHAEDYDLFTRISFYTKLANIQHVLYVVREHQNEVSIKYKDLQIANSIKIIKREFNNMGYNISDLEIKDFISLNHFEYNSINSDPLIIMKFLENIVKSNNNSRYIDEIFFIEKMKFLWFNFCFNRSSFSQYSHSKILTKDYYIPLRQMIKWRLLSFLRIFFF
jgi:glycosyltransferase involved in cell wall biosynthesis